MTPFGPLLFTLGMVGGLYGCVLLVVSLVNWHREHVASQAHMRLVAHRARAEARRQAEIRAWRVRMLAGGRQR